MKVAILGSGVIGTTVAHYLARDGHEVTVVERQRSAGYFSKGTRLLGTTRTRARHFPCPSVNLFRSPMMHLSPPTTWSRTISAQVIP